MKISVLGCGRWGSFIAWYHATVLKNNVILYGEDGRESYDILKAEGKNEYVALDKSITLTSDLAYALKESEVIIISISSQALREFMQKVVKHPVADKIFVLCMKGIEESTGKRLSEVMTDSGIKSDKIAVWVGPGHIQSFTAGVPNCMIIDSTNDQLKKYLAENFKSNLIRFYYGNDLLGTEVGAAAKNVLGIAAGVLDGSGYTSLKGPLMARGAFEVAKLIKAMGGNEMSAYGLAHLGDYETTLFSPYSHNRTYGEMMAKGQHFGKLAEGVMTAKAMKALGDKYNIELPITNAVYEGCFESDEFGKGEHDCLHVILKLFDRSIKNEFSF
ncbi:MAG: glycerol-3-phosphate dehydrogenase [Clostridia bacterium]|nr:glycerol-3-phosphate dehydrogenase [Clostridia bacterium]MDE6790521.1 glycerol-3-phosphate dehydrogenase [Clostridia bacterium]